MRKRFKCLIGATAAAVVVTPVVYVGYAMTHRDAGSPTTVGCSTVMAFAGGKLPTQAAGASCTDDNTWQEQGYSAEFRMPRADLPARLTE
ncbi:hypothetical protein ACIQOV_38345, partial [Kitasatospora sp. NPDC091257]|uniref:hypothetical protein n=1 Tax=Kitasatospora sp. NPDC091257 TaxID=3364084 RepID=UPI00382A9705